MKQIIICLIMIVSIGLLIAESSPVNDYFNSPSPQSFASAWSFCSDTLAKDSTMVNIKILMAYIANAEANRLAEQIASDADNLEPANKFQYANLLLSQNNYDDAIEIYNAINTETPGWSCPWRHKGQALYSQKRYKEAEVSLQQAIETNREHYDAYIWQAKTQYKLKKYKQALKNLETALTLSPGAEESQDELIADDSIKALHQELLKKTHK